MEFDNILSKLEDFSDAIVRKSRPIIPILGRLLLVSTFYEDGYRMVTNPKSHLDLLKNDWNMWSWLAFVCYFLCTFSLLVMPTLVLIRKKVHYACLVLALILAFQCVIHRLYESFTLLLRTFSTVGGVLILTAEVLTTSKPQTGASLPDMHDDIESKSIVILISRCYLIAMMISFLSVDELSFWRVIQIGVSILLSIGVVTGYRMKLAALALAIWMMFFNVYHNDWWNAGIYSFEYKKYDFFQTLSAIGGLLMLIHLGPGEIRMDRLKKQW